MLSTTTHTNTGGRATAGALSLLGKSQAPIIKPAKKQPPKVLLVKPGFLGSQEPTTVAPEKASAALLASHYLPSQDGKRTDLNAVEAEIITISLEALQQFGYGKAFLVTTHHLLALNRAIEFYSQHVRLMPRLWAEFSSMKVFVRGEENTVLQEWKSFYQANHGAYLDRLDEPFEPCPQEWLEFYNTKVSLESPIEFNKQQAVQERLGLEKVFFERNSRILKKYQKSNASEEWLTDYDELLSTEYPDLAALSSLGSFVSLLPMSILVAHPKFEEKKRQIFDALSLSSAKKESGHRDGIFEITNQVIGKFIEDHPSIFPGGLAAIPEALQRGHFLNAALVDYLVEETAGILCLRYYGVDYTAYPGTMNAFVNYFKDIEHRDYGLGSLIYAAKIDISNTLAKTYKDTAMQGSGLSKRVTVLNEQYLLSHAGRATLGQKVSISHAGGHGKDSKARATEVVDFIDGLPAGEIAVDDASGKYAQDLNDELRRRQTSPFDRRDSAIIDDTHSESSRPGSGGSARSEEGGCTTPPALSMAKLIGQQGLHRSTLPDEKVVDQASVLGDVSSISHL